jgi:hypothetical protein
MKLTGKLGMMLAAATAVVALAPATAYAATWNPISGTVYAGGAWYTSTNVRTVSSGGATLKANFNTVPKAGLAFRAINYNTGLQIGSIVYAPPIGTALTMGSASGGTKFVNSFRQENACYSCSPYTFDGSEYY